MRQFLSLIAMLVLVTTVAIAGPAAEKPAQPRATEDVVTATVQPTALTAAAGSEVTFAVDLAIADTWHLYDHSYTQDPETFFIGVDLMPGEEANLAGFAAAFPKGVEGEFMGEKVVMLHHHATVDVTVTLPADATGKVEIPLVLTAQACDDKICLQPSDVAVVAHVTVQ